MKLSIKILALLILVVSIWALFKKSVEVNLQLKLQNLTEPYLPKVGTPREEILKTYGNYHAIAAPSNHDANKDDFITYHFNKIIDHGKYKETNEITLEIKFIKDKVSSSEFVIFNDSPRTTIVNHNKVYQIEPSYEYILKESIKSFENLQDLLPKLNSVITNQ